MTQNLPPQPWMTAAPTRAVIEALEVVGGPGSARFVGGCVRDALLKRTSSPGSTDIDIATPLTPDVVTRALTDAGLKAIPTGIEHGTVTAIAEHKAIRDHHPSPRRRDRWPPGRGGLHRSDWAAGRRPAGLPPERPLSRAGRESCTTRPAAGIDDALAGRNRVRRRRRDPHPRGLSPHLAVLPLLQAWFGKGEADAMRAGTPAPRIEGGGEDASPASGRRKELLKLLAADDPARRRCG